MTKAIGGYFEIEKAGNGIFPHSKGILLNTGRNALEYILQLLPDIKKVYLPYYTCEVVLEPIIKLQLSYSFYHINANFELDSDLSLSEGEYLIVNNYFGIKDNYIQRLADCYGDQLIVDCSQAFFAPVIAGLKMFYSARKFVGVPDGGIAYGVDGQFANKLPQDVSESRLDHLYIRRDYGAEAGFKIYQSNEERLDGQYIKRMSDFTRNVLLNIDYSTIVQRRFANFKILHAALGYKNAVRVSAEHVVCPMAYPFYSDSSSLRDFLIKHRIYVAKYWPNVLDWCSVTDLEYSLTNHVIPLPIDQRYGEEDMKKIIRLL